MRSPAICHAHEEQSTAATAMTRDGVFRACLLAQGEIEQIGKTPWLHDGFETVGAKSQRRVYDDLGQPFV